MKSYDIISDVHKKILFVIAVVAVSIRLGTLFYGIETFGTKDFLFIYGDTPGYVEPASNLIAGKGYSVDYSGTLYPDTTRPPGYPILIAASLYFFESFLPLIALQIILAGIIPILGYALILRLFQDRTPALVVAWFLALEPIMVIISTTLLSETVFMAAFLSALVLFLSAFSENGTNRTLKLTLAGLLFSYAALVRPVGLYVLPVVALYAFYRLWKTQLPKKQFAALAAIFILACAIPVGAWMTRNKVMADSFTLTSLTGIVSYFRFGVSIIAVETGQNYDPVRQELSAKAQKDIGGELRGARNVGYYQRETRKIIREHFGAFVKLTGLGTFHLFTHDGYFDAVQRIVPDLNPPRSSAQITLIARGEFSQLAEIAKKFLAWPWVIFVAARLLWMTVFFSAVYGFIMLWAKKSVPRPLLLFLIALIILFTIPSLTLGLAVEARIRMPINIFLISFAFYGAWHFKKILLKWKFF